MRIQFNLHSLKDSKMRMYLYVFFFAKIEVFRVLKPVGIGPYCSNGGLRFLLQVD